ncbi:MAG TPA: hypothetical protein VLA15_10975, partial [Desulfurivibrionaceae bacterium]|nr:hypothetical protein [Desulfurivibrionaceae bacterium]
ATTLTAEAAGSKTKLSTGERSGSAWLATVEHRTTEIDSQVYVRENGEGFGLGQQAGSEQGMRKIGGRGRYRLDETVSIGAELSRESNMTSGGDRDLAQTDVQFTEKTYTIGGGLREAIDHPASGEKNSSSQLFVTGSKSVTPRLKVRLSHDQSLADSGGESANYPTRTVMGADYQLSQHTALFAEQEFTFGAAEDSNMTRLGLKATPWNGSEVSSRIEQQSTEYGPRVFASTGLRQNWQLDQSWSVDAGLDRSETLRHPGNPVGGTAVPASGGAEDFTAVSLGANRKTQNWTWSNRLEQRFSDSEDKFGIYSGVEGDVREGLAISGKAQIFNSTRSSGPKQLNGDLRGGLAWRPAKTRWIILDRIDYLFNRQSGSEFNFSNWRVVNNLNANFRPDWLTQVAFQYGAKYVHETIDNRSYSGYTDLLGIEGRRDFAKKWDIGVQAQTLNSWQSDQRDYRLAPSVGYRAVKNVWLSVGYNLVGFTDRDFSAADFTAQGPFIKFRFKFDQTTVREALQAF